MKKIVLLSLILCFMLTACKNFLNAGKVKDEITAMIDYNNAPAYTILVEADRASGALLKPITGELKKKATDVFPVKFEPNEGYKFYKWVAFCKDPLGENDSISNYIEFEDETSLETNVTFKKGLKNIVIRPVCPAIPEVQVEIDGDNGNFSPSKGVYTKKAGSVTSVIFDADPSFAFIQWKIIDKTTGSEIPNGKYLLLENPTESRTSFEIVDTPASDSDIKLLLQPVTMERPEVLSWWPDTKGDRATKDASIQVVFDREIDEDSIYYTSDEFTQINAPDKNIYWFYSSKNGRPYAYEDPDEENPIKVYKNIVIRYDDDPTSNINHCYGEPVFDNPRSITLPVDRSLNENDFPKDWSSILVSFEKGLFYYVKISDDPEIKKTVKMSQSKRWIYEVNNETDTKAPVLTTYTVKTSATDGTDIPAKNIPTNDKLNYSNITSYDGDTFFYTNTMYVNFALNDGLNSIAKTFEIYYRKAYDEYYNKTNQTAWNSKTITYHSTGKSASYTGEINFLSSEYGFSDGLYQIYFKFTDASGNPRYYPGDPSAVITNPQPPTTTFNICIDNGTHISMPDQTITQYEEKMVLKLANSNQILPGDLKSITVYNGTTLLKSFDNTVTVEQLNSVEIPLNSWETYNINVNYVDYKNKNSLKTFQYTTPKPTITPKHLDFTNGNLFSVLDLGLSSIPNPETVTLLVTVEKLDSNNNYVPITPSADGKYEIKQGNVYHIEIDGSKNGSSINRISREYTMFTKPKPLDVRFTPVVNSHSGDVYQCELSYIIPRIPSENSGIRYKVNGVETSNNKGTTTIKYISGSTPEVSPFTVETLPPAGINFEVTDSSSFVAPLNLQYYGKTKEAVIQNNTVMAFKVQKYYDNLPSANLSDTAINIVYNGNLLAGPQVIYNASTSDVTISIENNSIPVDTSLKASQGMYFVIESVKYSTLKYIARDEYVICPTAATAVSNLVYNKDNKTLTWTNPPQDEFATIKIYAEYKPVGSGVYQIPTRALFGEISDKSINSFVCSNISSLELLSSLKFSVNTTNAAGTETTKVITVK